jgi:hypothetical protein
MKCPYCDHELGTHMFSYCEWCGRYSWQAFLANRYSVPVWAVLDVIFVAVGFSIYLALSDDLKAGNLAVWDVGFVLMAMGILTHFVGEGFKIKLEFYTDKFYRENVLRIGGLWAYIWSQRDNGDEYLFRWKKVCRSMNLVTVSLILLGLLVTYLGVK